MKQEVIHFAYVVMETADWSFLVGFVISCKDCDKTYIGNAKGNLGTRAKEHSRNIKMEK